MRQRRKHTKREVILASMVGVIMNETLRGTCSLSMDQIRQWQAWYPREVATLGKTQCMAVVRGELGQM